MKYLIMVSHGHFAEGVKSSLEMFAGDANDRVFALCLHNGKSADDFKQEVNNFFDKHQFNADDEFIVLADIIGGSPLTTFLNVFNERGYLKQAVVLGGMNFTMALTVCVSLDTMGKTAIAQSALKEAKDAINQYEIPEEQADDDDEI